MSVILSFLPEKFKCSLLNVFFSPDGITPNSSLTGPNNHHHHVALVARISLTLSRHSSLSFIALGRSSGQHPVSSHSCWMCVRAGRPDFARPCVGVHKSTSLISSSLLLQQCPACLVRLTWIVFVIGGRWPYRIIPIYIYIYIYLGVRVKSKYLFFIAYLYLKGLNYFKAMKMFLNFFKKGSFISIPSLLRIVFVMLALIWPGVIAPDYCPIYGSNRTKLYTYAKLNSLKKNCTYAKLNRLK